MPARIPLRFVTLLAVLCSVAAAAFAIDSASGIRGRVVDRDGAPIPGVTLAVVHPGLGTTRGAVTDARGEFRIAPLPPGKGYRLTASFPGLATVTIPDIDLSPGVLAVVPVALRPGAEIEERVRVVGEGEIIRTDDTTAGATFESEFIDALPILGRNYQDILTLAPGVSDVDGDGNPNIHGARDTDVVTLVDGVSTVDPLTGTVGQQLNIDSIQEIEVRTSGASAEFSRGQGGFVTVLTKSGGNDFEGTFKFFWRSDLFDGDGAGIDDPRLHGGLGESGLRELSFDDYMPFVSVGGPIVRDRAWYFVTAEWIQEETPVNAQTQTFVRTTKEKRAFAKLTWQAAQNHRIVFSATIDPQEYGNLGLNSFTEVEAGYTMEQGGLNLVLRGTSIFNPNVFLESTVQDFRSRPGVIPTLDADTNGNGVLYVDRNGNGFIEASERDIGEDYDADGAWDVYEDIVSRNFRLDAGEDLDHDRRLTGPKGCEGATREDLDCDGILDPGEDRNGNGALDDRPFPSSADTPIEVLPDGSTRLLPSAYPYATYRPMASDRDYEIDLRTQVARGPYPTSYDREVSRVTLREDLSVFVPDARGQHDLKMGGVVEDESYHQSTDLRPTRLRIATKFVPEQVGIILPAEPHVENSADSLTFGAYIQDTWKPAPNLTLGLGLRFDRETTDSFGYTQFDPAAERALYDRLWALGSGERLIADAELGNGDGIRNLGYCADPLFLGLGCPFDPTKNPILQDLGRLQLIASSRLTQHHTSTTIVANSLKALYPNVITIDPATGEEVFDREALRALGAATFQEQEPFRLTNNNLAPRLFVAWDPGGDGRTKVYANWSRYFDKLFLASVVPEEGPDQISRYYQSDADGITAQGIPNNRIGTPLSKAPPSATQVDRGLQTPFTDEFSIGFERELAPDLAVRAAFIRRDYRQQLQDRDINHELRFDADGRPRDDIGQLITFTNGRSPQPAPDGHPDLYINNFFFNQIYKVGNYNDARYRAIELGLTRRLSRRWQADASYVYSRAVGAAESFQSELGDDPSNIEDEYGYLAYDQRHVVKVSGVTFLPRDWQVGGTMTWGSGLPYSIIDRFTAVDNYQYQQLRTLYGYVSPTIDADGRYRFVPVHRNSERNPSVLNVNLRVQKSLVMGGMATRISATVDNLLNTDDITIYTYSPGNSIRSGSLQLDAERRFGRRFEIGFQLNF